MSTEDHVIRFTVTLNGTDQNPYHRWGHTQNPFPQLAKYEYARHMLHLQKLGGDPIPDLEYIRKHLAGYSQEFIDLCCRRFKKGEMVRFDVFFNE